MTKPGSYRADVILPRASYVYVAGPLCESAGEQGKATKAAINAIRLRRKCRSNKTISWFVGVLGNYSSQNSIAK